MFQDQSEEDHTLSRSSSQPPGSVQFPNASVHSSADGEQTKKSALHVEARTDHTSLLHPSGRARAPHTEPVEEATEIKQEADTRTEPNREWDERLEDEEDEGEEKDTHMEPEARAQDNTDTSR